MRKVFDKYQIAYSKISNSIHPTTFTDEKGCPLTEIDASNVGVMTSPEKFSDKFLFDELYYDSALEKDNIMENIEEVIVFTKIPKGSICIPVVGGVKYSPDFAYVVKMKNGKQNLNFIVETKNAQDEELRLTEKIKIAHAKKFFGNAINIHFKEQFSETKIVELINEIQKEASK